MSLLVVSGIEEPKKYDTTDVWQAPSQTHLSELDWNTNMSGRGSYITQYVIDIPSREHWYQDEYMEMRIKTVIKRIRGVQDVLIPYSTYKEYLV